MLFNGLFARVGGNEANRCPPPHALSLRRIGRPGRSSCRPTPGRNPRRGDATCGRSSSPCQNAGLVSTLVAALDLHRLVVAGPVITLRCWAREAVAIGLPALRFAPHRGMKVLAGMVARGLYRLAVASNTGDDEEARIDCGPRSRSLADIGASAASFADRCQPTTIAGNWAGGLVILNRAPATASRKTCWMTCRGRRNVRSGCQTQNDRMPDPPVFDILTG